MNSIEAVRALVERGGAIWRERWEVRNPPRSSDRIVLLTPRGNRLALERTRATFHPSATDWLATDWKWAA